MSRPPATPATPAPPETPTGPAAIPLDEPPATDSGQPGEGNRLRAVLALARFEVRELLFQIQIVFFFLLYLGLVVVGLIPRDGMDAYPVLNTVDRGTQSAPLLFAISVLVCTNAAALRSRKHSTVQQFDVLPVEPWRRTLAHVLSVVPFAALTGLVAVGAYTWEALKPGAIGHGSVGELAVAPLTVLLAGATGVLLARVVPTPFAPILFVIAYYLVFFMVASGTEGEWPSWLSPVMYANIGGDPVPSDLLGRPATAHAVYLLGLCAIVICAALLRAGGRTRAVKTATALALATTVAGAIGQLPYDSAELAAARRTATETPEKVQSCVERDGSTYCSFPEWNGVRPGWAEVVGRVQALAGGAAAKASLTVRQRVDTSSGVETDSYLVPLSAAHQVTVGTRWGGNRVPEFAVGVATVLVMGSEEAAVEREMCDARPVTIMWLALGADRDPSATFQDLRVDDSTEGGGTVLAPTNPLNVTADQSTVVRELLDRPRAEITARVKAHWAELTSARTTTAEAAKLLGVPVPKEAEQCDE